MGDWQESANRRRDERQTKVPIIRRPSGSRKDTKRWCRGVEGREHTPVCVPYKQDAIFKSWRNYTCSACGKVLATYWPCWASDKNLYPKPTWVVD